jgi:hypothetical protein
LTGVSEKHVNRICRPIDKFFSEGHDKKIKGSKSGASEKETSKPLPSRIFIHPATFDKNSPNGREIEKHNNKAKKRVGRPGRDS